jgi:hypothetical protein
MEYLGALFGLAAPEREILYLLPVPLLLEAALRLVPP